MKSLTRNPLTQWKRMMECNIESMQVNCKMDTGGIISESVNLLNFKPETCKRKRKLAVESCDYAEKNQMINNVSNECTNVNLELNSNLRSGLNFFAEKCDSGGINNKTFDTSIEEIKHAVRCEPDEWLWHSVNLGTIEVSHSECSNEEPANQSIRCAFNNRNEVTECFYESNEIFVNNHVMFSPQDTCSERDWRKCSSTENRDTQGKHYSSPLNGAEDTEANKHSMNIKQNSIVYCVEECSAYSESSDSCDYQTEDTYCENRAQKIDKHNFENNVRAHREYKQADTCFFSAVYLDSDQNSTRDVINGKVPECTDGFEETIQIDQGNKNNIVHTGDVPDDSYMKHKCIYTLTSTDKDTFNNCDKIEPLGINVDSELISKKYIYKSSNDYMLDLSVSDLINVEINRSVYFQDENEVNALCEKGCLMQDIVTGTKFKSETGRPPCKKMRDGTTLSDFDEEGNSSKVLTIKNSEISKRDCKIISVKQTCHISEMRKGTDLAVVDTAHCTSQSVLCSANHHDEVQDELPSKAVDIQEYDSVTDLGCGDGFLKKDSCMTNRNKYVFGFAFIPYKNPRQIRTHKSSSAESILAWDRHRTQKCQIKSVKCEPFNRISYVDIDISNIPKHLITSANVCDDLTRASIKRDDCGLLQCLKQVAAEASMFQPSDLKCCNSECGKAPERKSNRTLKQLTRNPMTQWKRLVDANLESVLSMKADEIDRAKLGGGDTVTHALNKSEGKILKQNFQELDLRGTESDIEKLCLCHSDTNKTGTCNIYNCVTHFIDAGHLECTSSSVIYEQNESTKTKAVDFMRLPYLEIDASVKHSDFSSNLFDSGYSEFDEDDATCSGLECQSLTEQISELATDKSTEDIPVFLEVSTHETECKTEIQKNDLHICNSYGSVAVTVCNLSNFEDNITPVTSVNNRSSKIKATDDTQVVNAESDCVFKLCGLSKKLLYSNNSEEASSNASEKKFQTKLDNGKVVSAVVSDWSGQEVVKQITVNANSDLDQINICNQKVQTLKGESDSSCKVDNVTNKFEVNFCSDNSEQMSISAGIDIQNAKFGDDCKSGRYTHTTHSSECEQVVMTNTTNTNILLDQLMLAPSAFSPWISVTKTDSDETEIEITTAFETKATFLSTSINNLATGLNSKKDIKVSSNAKYDQENAFEINNHEKSNFQNSCSTLKVLDKSISEQKVQPESVLSPLKKLEERKCNLNSPSNHTCINDVVSKAPERKSNRTLKQLTRNPMTQWKRLVDANLESVLSMKADEIDRAKLGGGDTVTHALNKSEGKILKQNFQELDLRGTEHDIEKLCLCHSDTNKTGTCNIYNCVTHFIDAGHLECTSSSVIYEQNESTKTKAVDFMRLPYLEIDASVKHSDFSSNLFDSGYSEFDEDDATCSGLECQSLTEQISELATDKSTEDIPVFLEVSTHETECKTEIQKNDLHICNSYGSVAVTVCNLSNFEDNITPVTSVNNRSSKIKATDDTQVVNAESDGVFKLCGLSKKLLYSNNSEKNSVYISLASSNASEKKFQAKLDNGKIVSAVVSDWSGQEVVNQITVNANSDLDQINICSQKVQTFKEESDSSYEVGNVTNKFEVNFCSDNSEQMSISAGVDIQNAKFGDDCKSGRYTHTSHSSECEQVVMTNTTNTNILLDQLMLAPSAFSPWISVTKTDSDETEIEITTAFETKATFLSTSINNLATGLNSKKDIKVSSNAKYDQENAFEINNHENSNFQNSCSTLKVLDKSISEQKVQPESVLSPLKKLEERKCNLNSPSNHTCINDVVRPEIDNNSSNEVFTSDNHLIRAKFSLCNGKMSPNSSTKYLLGDNEMKNKTVEVLDELLFPQEHGSQHVGWSFIFNFMTRIFKVHPKEQSSKSSNVNQKLKPQNGHSKMAEMINSSKNVESNFIHDFKKKYSDPEEMLFYYSRSLHKNEKKSLKNVCNENTSINVILDENSTPDHCKHNMAVCKAGDLLDKKVDADMTINNCEQLNVESEITKSDRGIFCKDQGENICAMTYKKSRDRFLTSSLDHKYDAMCREIWPIKKTPDKEKVSSFNQNQQNIENNNKQKHGNGNSVRNNMLDTNPFKANIVNGGSEMKNLSQNELQKWSYNDDEDISMTNEKYFEYEDRTENGDSIGKIVYEDGNKEKYITESNKSVSVSQKSFSIIQFKDTPTDVKETLVVNTDIISNETVLSNFFRNSMNQKKTENVLDPGQQIQSSHRGENTELVGNDLLQSSLECLLEMLLQRGKVIHAFVANIKGEILAKTADFDLKTSDIKSLICSLTSSYKGMIKITIFNDVYTCFKHDQDSSLVGNAASGIFVAHLGRQSIVVGFSNPTTPGSCIKEMHEISQILSNRGL